MAAAASCVRPSKGVLLVGFDAIVEQVAAVLRGSVVGVIGPAKMALPGGILHLGDQNTLRETLSTCNPGHIVVAREQAGDGNVLQELISQSHGLVVESASAAYERTFERTSVHGLSPEEFVSSARLVSDRQTLAFQSSVQ
jgi:hypothetical protein